MELLIRVGFLAFKIPLTTVLDWIIWIQFHWNEFPDALTPTSATTPSRSWSCSPCRPWLAALSWSFRRLGFSLAVGARTDAWLVGRCARQILLVVVGGDAARVIRSNSMQRSDIPTEST